MVSREWLQAVAAADLTGGLPNLAGQNLYKLLLAGDPP